MFTVQCWAAPRFLYISRPSSARTSPGWTLTFGLFQVRTCLLAPWSLGRLYWNVPRSLWATEWLRWSKTLHWCRTRQGMRASVDRSSYSHSCLSACPPKAPIQPLLGHPPWKRDNRLERLYLQRRIWRQFHLRCAACAWPAPHPPHLATDCDTSPNAKVNDYTRPKPRKK